MDNQSSATMNLEQLQQLISSQVQQHTTPLHNQVRDLENTNQQLRTLVSQLQVGQNIGQQYNNELGGRVKAAKPKTYNGSIASDPDVMLTPLLPMPVGHYRLGASVICGARHDIMEQA
jgi:hypothetical protein